MTLIIKIIHFVCYVYIIMHNVPIQYIDVCSNYICFTLLNQ